MTDKFYMSTNFPNHPFGKGYSRPRSSLDRMTNIVETQSGHSGVEEEERALLAPVDGQRAWTVAVALTVIGLFTGLPNCWENVFTNPHAAVQLTFLGTLFRVLLTVCMFAGTTLFTLYGADVILISGVTMTTIGLILAAMSFTIWQLYFSLSICCGIGLSFLCVAPLLLLPEWFVKYRSTAFGIQHSSFPFTSLVLPLVMVRVNDSLGPSWTYRLLGITFFATAAAMIPFIKERRVRKSQRKSRRIRHILDVSLLKDMNLMIWVILGPIQLYAMYITFVFLPSNATYLGLTDVQGAATVTALSGAGLVGRIIFGAIADKIGDLNTYIICMVVSTVTIWINWFFATSFTSLMIFAVLHGLVHGMYFVISSQVTYAIVGEQRYASALGLKMLPFVVSICGPLVASYLDSINGHTPFLYCKLIAGAGFAVSIILGLLLKFRMERKLWAKV
ncbi:major facilitator superfamily domain-containing protein [Fennellomyces sp. T-0311]|nr:major facilitator superfamily domain-containing protein [Fennellomyces sp. T-0311]